MTELHPFHASKSTPPQRILPVLEKLKSAYLLWFICYQTLPKTHRYSIGQKVDATLIDAIEAVTAASFLSPAEKQPWVRLAIRKIDTFKILLMVLWETKSLDNKKYVTLSVPFDEIGRMLGGWNGQLQKKNSPAGGAEEK